MSRPTSPVWDPDSPVIEDPILSDEDLQLWLWPINTSAYDEQNGESSAYPTQPLLSEDVQLEAPYYSNNQNGLSLGQFNPFDPCLERHPLPQERLNTTPVQVGLEERPSYFERHNVQVR
jgi:hypothetical protein